jgi:hypothetical protein
VDVLHGHFKDTHAVCGIDEDLPKQLMGRKKPAVKELARSCEQRSYLLSKCNKPQRWRTDIKEAALRTGRMADTPRSVARCRSIFQTV